jgi:hypothetical protein
VFLCLERMGRNDGSPLERFHWSRKKAVKKKKKGRKTRRDLSFDATDRGTRTEVQCRGMCG